MRNSTLQAPFVIYFALCIPFSNTVSAQELTGTQLLEQAIKFHDPSNQWPTFNGALQITMSTPKGSPRVSDIAINLPQEYFSVTAKRDAVITTDTIDKGICTTSIKEEAAEGKRTPCETAQRYKNYYTYLYGLPMKLMDNGTIITEVIERKTFKRKEYLVLKASYDKTVGSDVWYFYFDPKTYAMEIYQFYHDETNNDGEYIILSETAIIGGIKMPKKRAWFTNKENRLLGTDILN
jgi:hypothetical protein